MFFRRLSLFLLSLFSLITFALPASAQDRPRIAVLELRAKGEAASEAAGIISDRIRSLVVQSRVFQVMERESMDKILREQGFQSTQICEDDGCSLQIGRLLSVNGILTGSLTKVGNLQVINLRIIDTQTGAILKEDFLDCACSLELIIREKLQPLVGNLIGTQSEKPETIAETISSDLPVRRARPWLLGLNVGVINFADLELQYNFNEYFALHLNTGFGTNQSYSYFPDGSSYTTSYPGPFLKGGVRTYFNPQDWAGYFDLAYNTNSWIDALVGIEYRSPQGFTFNASGGLAYALFTGLPNFNLSTGIGYAF